MYAFKHILGNYLSKKFKLTYYNLNLPSDINGLASKVVGHSAKPKDMSIKNSQKFIFVHYSLSICVIT